MSSRRVKFKSAASGQRKSSQRIDDFEMVIRDLTSDGRGVGEAPDGQVVFVGGAWVDERVHVRGLVRARKQAPNS